MSKLTHYPLIADEFLKLNALLKDAELRVYLYLMVLNPFQNSVIEIDTAQISEQLGLTRRTIQRAIKRLQELHLIEVEITRFKYKKAVHGVSSRLGSDDTRIASGDTRIASGDTRIASGDTRIATNDTRIASGDTRIASGDTRIATNDTRIADTPPKALPDNDSSTPQIYIYSDFIRSLSEEERANFLEFCQEKTKNLSQEVNDIEAWLANKNKAGRNRWEVYYEKFVLATQQKKNKPDKRDHVRAFEQWQQELEERRLRGERAGKEAQAQNQSSGGKT